MRGIPGRHVRRYVDPFGCLPCSRRRQGEAETGRAKVLTAIRGRVRAGGKVVPDREQALG